MKRITLLLVGIVLGIAAIVVLMRPGGNPRENHRAPTAVPVNEPQAMAPVAVAPTPTPAADMPAALASFREWLPRYAAVGAQAASANLIEEGRRLAQARKLAMLNLMRENPQRALEQSLTWHEWATLPAEIRALVEEPFSETADLSVIPDCRAVNARQTPWQTHRAAMRGDHFDAFVFGRREQGQSKLGIPLQGIRLEKQVALWEGAAQSLGDDDLRAAQQIFRDGNERNRSWVSGERLNGFGKAALIGGKIHYFADAEEIRQVASVIAEAEVQPGPHNVVEAMATTINGGVFDAKAFTAAAKSAQSAWTESPKRVLAMIVNFTPASTNHYTTNVLASELLITSNSIRQMSFGKTWLSNTVVPQLISLSNAQSYWETNDSGADGMMDAAKAAAAGLGYVLANYDIFAIAMPRMNRYNGSAAFAGGQGLWIHDGPTGSGNVTHEVGHNYGYSHANYWRGGTGSGFLGIGGGLEHQEYGDVFDRMGNGPGDDAPNTDHFSMRAKSFFNWIEPSEVVNASTNGVYRLRRFDHIDARLLPGTKLALQVRNAMGDEFWIGYRRALTNAGYESLTNSAYVIWANGFNSHRLIDTTPLSQPNQAERRDRLDAALPVGRTYTDPSGTLRIKTLATGGSSPNEYVDVEVMLITNVAPLVLNQFDLFTTSALTTNGLIGSYVNTSLRSYSAQDDWRTSQPISGTRRDAYPLFPDNVQWGARASVGVTGGSSDGDWENYSVQWDGWIRIYTPTRFSTLSDDSSRMWIDVNGNGTFGNAAPEYINNHWGTGQGDTYGNSSDFIAPGTYRIRIQYEEGVGDNHFALYGASEPAAPFAPYPRSVAALNPWGYWRLNETYGTTAIDSVNNNHGTYTNATLGQPGYGSAAGNGTDPTSLAAQFGPANGAQSFVSIPGIDVSVPNGGNGAFSVAAWVLASNSTPVNAGIFEKGYGGGDEQFGLACGANGNAFQFFVRNAQSGTASLANSSVHPDNQWHFLVGVCDQANSVIRLYVDGTNAAQGPISPGTGIRATTVPASIGARKSGSGTPYDLQFIGLIDDVAIFTNALAPTQIGSLYPSPPVITQQPSPRNLFVGGNLGLSVVAGNAQSYAWRLNGTPIPGANNAAYSLPNVQLTNAGSYSVICSNYYFAVTSAPVSVAVLPVPVAPYPVAIAYNHPLAYWRLDETNGVTAFDYVNGNNGFYSNAVLGQSGYGSAAGTGTETSALAARFGPNGAQSHVSIPTVDLSVPNGGYGEFSIAAWVMASNSVSPGAGIVVKGDGNGDEQFGLACGGNGNAFQFFVRDAQFNVLSLANSSIYPDNNWHWLVGVCDQANSVIWLYVDGNLAAGASIAAGAGIHPTVRPTSIGARTSNSGAPYDLQFIGLIDDVAIFPYPIPSGLVSLVYNQTEYPPAITQQPVAYWVAAPGSTASNKVVVTGSDLSYQWYGPTGAIPGATSSVLVLTNVQPSQSGSYYAVVTAPFNGSLQSSNAFLNVYTPFSVFGQYFQDFNGFPEGATAFGDGAQVFSTAFSVAVVTDRTYKELQLTEAIGAGVQSAFLLPDLTPGLSTPAFSAKWNSQIWGEFNDAGGEGFSFNFGQVRSLNLLNGAEEAGYGTGLCFSVQTDATNNPGFYLRVNGAIVASQPFDPLTQLGYLRSTRHFFEVDWNYLTGITVRGNGYTIFSNVPTSGFIPRPGDSFVWAARTSSNKREQIRLDNVMAVTGGNLVPAPAVAPFYSNEESQPAANAFDGNIWDPNYAWMTTQPPGYVGATVPGNNYVAAYALTSYADFSGRLMDPASWVLQGTTNGEVSWQNCATGGGYFLNPTETRGWLTTNTTPFSAYRLNVAANRGNFYATALQELTFYHFVPGITVPSPRLDVARSGGNVALTWTTNLTAGFALQQNSNLSTTNWTPVTNPVTTTTNGQYQVLVPSTNNHQFFRLAQ